MKKKPIKAVKWSKVGNFYGKDLVINTDDLFILSKLQDFLAKFGKFVDNHPS